MSVGYKNPPKAAPYKKEQPANANGRSTVQRLPAAYLFRKVANEKVAVEVNGAKVRMTHWEALLRQLHIMAHKNWSVDAVVRRLRFNTGSPPRGAQSPRSRIRPVYGAALRSQLFPTRRFPRPRLVERIAGAGALRDRRRLIGGDDRGGAAWLSVLRRRAQYQ
jgi:hypothetical protein